MKDFLFGNLNSNTRKVVEIEMRALGAIASTMGKEPFLRHLNRLLEGAPSNTIDVIHPTSAAEPLVEILSSLSSGVDLVMVLCGEPVNDINTIRMDFVLKSGVVSFRPHWSLYKGQQIKEFRDSLVHIVKAGLSEKLATMNELKHERLDIFSDEGVENLFLIGEASIYDQSFTSSDFIGYIKHGAKN
jgi:hypothetical protein